jgi:diaminohydroxyphosphoribosylaminopyrimidine deaminase / 5-amino-6-(5-phosphoribosylamino)uracil reductase
MTMPNICTDHDHVWMTKALALAERGLYTTTPNPRVGCIVVKNGEPIAEGWHERAGQAHAEVVALREAGPLARGATAYVTLEPCNHHGRTGPCSLALIEAGVAEVVYAMVDPNPLVAGQGLARLRSAGIALRGPVCEASALALNVGFVQRMTQNRPWVRLKLAMSLDGRTAMANGESQWITGEAAREDVQRWRARSCAIVTGSGTALADAPQLTVRLADAGPNPRQPLRVLVDSDGKTPANAPLFTGPGEAILASAQPLARAHWLLPGSDGKVDLHALLGRLAAWPCNEVLIEAGPRLAGAFLQQDLVDELVIYMASKLLGSSARPLVDWPLTHLAEAPAFDIQAITPVGEDWRILARPR